jgi:hypothetical protein
MGEWGTGRDVGRKAFHFQICVRAARFAPWPAKSVRGWRRQERALQKRALVVTSEERLASILEMLEECRVGLAATGNRDSADLVSMAILDVRMRLHRIGHAELRALCDEMLADGSPQTSDTKPASGRKRPPLLRVVK